MRHLLNGQRYMVSVVGHLAFMALGGEERGRKEGRKEGRKQGQGRKRKVMKRSCSHLHVAHTQWTERERERESEGFTAETVVYSR